MLKGKQTLFSKIAENNPMYNLDDKSIDPLVMPLKVLIIIVSVLMIGLFFVMNLDNKPYDTPDYRIVAGNVWEGAPIVVEFSYPIYKSQTKYLDERRKAAESVLPVFVLDETVEEGVLNKLDNYLLVLSEFNENLDKSPEFSFPEKVISPILSLNKNQKDVEIKKIQSFLTKYIKNVYSGGFINISVDRMSVNEISVKVSKNEFAILKVSNLTDKNLFVINAEKMIANNVSQISQPLVLEILNKLNTPNLTFSKELTDEAIELELLNVPRTSGYVRKGEMIISNGELLTEENILKINSYQSSSYMRGNSTVSILYYIGGFGHAGILVSILLLYLMIIRKNIFADNAQIGILMAVLIITSALAWLSNQIHTIYPLELLIIIPALSMLVAIVYDSRTAFYTTITMALLLAGIRGNDYVTGTTMIFTGILAGYTVRDIQSRTQMYKSIFYIFIGFAITIFIFGAERSLKMEEILTNLAFGFINSLMAPLLTFGLLFVIERFSDISTDLRIKEFDNLDNPLMRLISEKAPGTYQHTLSVALLAERCAREIGANPLLTKVGAYYHDLGKITKSEYFTENQIGMENKHDILVAKKSAKIIIDHVNDGVKLAKEYKLPQRLMTLYLCNMAQH
jgi:putative nucleotidyltransferase with HDIG domain